MAHDYNLSHEKKQRDSTWKTLQVSDAYSSGLCYEIVNYLKGVSSHLIRKKGYPSVCKKLWGEALWSPSYFAGSCGGAPISIIRQYIEQQQTPS
jgi:hypothetical protein